MPTVADRNLLFGIVALQMDFITRPQLLQALNATGAQDHALGDILQQHGVLSASRRALLDALVAEQLRNGAAPDLPVSSPCSEVDSAATRAGTLAAPAEVGMRFRILRPYAEGGLGKVSVALDTELRREVALKEIKERYADNPDSRARFVQEAEITGGLEHPGIVPVYGLGQYADGRPFYAMRFIRGDSLKEAIERFHTARTTENSDPGNVPSVPSVPVVDFFSLEFRKLLGPFLEVCNAIAYAHSRGVLHRDLKPGNVMLGKFGETLVVDWGLAKAAGSRQATDVSGEQRAAGADEAPLTPASGSGSSETVAGSAIGTPQFMSPEQAAGRLDLLGPASDVYSLGATLYCLLTGKAPIDDQEVSAVLRRVQKGDFPRPRAVHRAIPAALEAICLRAMALRPQDRYSSPRELAEDVERWLADERVLAYAEPPRVRIWRWTRRHRTFVSAAAGLLLASAILLGISTATFSVMHKEADALRNKADKALRAGQRSAYVNAIRLANEHWEDSDPKDIPELLANAGPPELRGWEWGHLNYLLRGPTRNLPMPWQTQAFARSPDAARFAVAAADGSIKVWDAATGRELHSLRAGTSPVIAFSADGQQLFAAGMVGGDSGKLPSTEIKSWQMTDGREVSAVRHKSIQAALSLSPDVKRLVGADADANLKLWDVASGKALFTLDSKQASAFAYSADGKWLAIGGVDGGRAEQKQGYAGDVSIWETATGKKLLSLPDQWNRATALAFHPGRKELAVGTDNGLVTRWDLTDQKLGKRPLWDHTGAVSSLAYSRDGAWLAIGGADRAITLVHAQDRGESLSRLRGHLSAVNGLTFDSAGKVLISAGSAINFWDLARPPGHRVLPSFAANVAFDPRGQILVYGDQDVNLVETDSGRATRLLQRAVRGGAGDAVAIDKKGDRLAVGWADGGITMQDVAGGPALRLSGHQGPVERVAFSPAPDGPLASFGADGVVKLWDRTGRELFSLPSATSPMAFSHDGKRLAIGGAGGVVRLLDPASGKEITSLTTNSGDVRLLAFHPDGNRLATAHGAGRESVVKLWQLPGGEELPTINGRPGMVTALLFSPDGRRLVTGSGQGRIMLWDFVCGNEVFEINLFSLLEREATVRDMAFSPDGLTLAATTGREVLLWKALASDGHGSGTQ